LNVINHIILTIILICLLCFKNIPFSASQIVMFWLQKNINNQNNIIDDDVDDNDDYDQVKLIFLF